MKLYPTLISSLLMVPLVGAAFSSCGSDDPEPEPAPPVVKPDPDPEPDPTPEPDPKDAIQSYFLKSLNGERPDTLAVAPIAMTVADYDANKAEIWEAWKQANKTFNEPQLPAYAPMNASSG